MDLKVPPAGESISTVMISEWLVEEGDEISEDQTVVILETDKINVEVPSPVTGVMGKILKGPGQEADIGEVIAEVSEGGSGNGAPAKKSAPKKEQKEESASKSEKTEDAEGSDEAIASPAAQRLLEENKISKSDVSGTGKDGRILKEDVLEVIESRDEEKQQKPSEEKRPKKEQAPAPARSSQKPERGEREEVVPMSPLRRKIAQTLVSAQQTAAILSTFNEVDMSAVMDLRKQYQDQFVKKYGIKLGFMSFFVKAAVEALKAYPAVNSEIRENSVVYKNYYDIGVAVGTDKGLVVPVLRDSDSLSLAEIELGIKELAGKARDMKLTLADLEGGTFTISNGGIYGSMLSTPILNPPQSGILGLHNIQERPVAVNGKVEIRPMMYLALSYDHRVIDGKGAVSFLVHLKNIIEDPARMLLEI